MMRLELKGNESFFSFCNLKLIIVCFYALFQLVLVQNKARPSDYSAARLAEMIDFYEGAFADSQLHVMTGNGMNR